MSKTKTTVAAEILNHWRTHFHTTFVEIAAQYEIKRNALFTLANGSRDLDKAGRELRNGFLNVALTIPESQRSAQLQEWIERTEKYFEEKPLGGKFV